MVLRETSAASAAALLAQRDGDRGRTVCPRVPIRCVPYPSAVGSRARGVLEARRCGRSVGCVVLRAQSRHRSKLALVPFPRCALVLLPLSGLALGRLPLASVPRINGDRASLRDGRGVGVGVQGGRSMCDPLRDAAVDRKINHVGAGPSSGRCWRDGPGGAVCVAGRPGGADHAR